LDIAEVPCAPPRITFAIDAGTKLMIILVLRLLHILSGAFWYGATMFAARFLMPSLKAVGPAAGPVMAQLNQRKLSQAMMGAAIVNVLSGVGLMFVVSGGDMGAWMQLNSSKVFATGGTLAILALIVGMVMNPPAAKRMGQIAAAAAKRGGPPTPEEAVELGALEARLRTGSAIVATLLTLAVAAMAVARYT
jgi:uncharacterized membrane protein